VERNRDVWMCSPLHMLHALAFSFHNYIKKGKMVALFDFFIISMMNILKFTLKWQWWPMSLIIKTFSMILEHEIEFTGNPSLSTSQDSINFSVQSNYSSNYHIFNKTHTRMNKNINLGKSNNRNTKYCENVRKPIILLKLDIKELVLLLDTKNQVVPITLVPSPLLAW